MTMTMTTANLNQQYSDKNKWPTFTNSEISLMPEEKNVFVTNCEIPSSLSWFKGHFPEQAVLPGVVQVNWANTIAKNLFKIEEFRGVNSLKFNTMILPDNTVTLSLAFNSEKQTVKFSYKSDDLLYSSGILVFATVNH